MITSKATENGLTPDLKELFVRDQKWVLRLKHRLGIDRQFSLHVGVKSNRVKRSVLRANLIYHSMNDTERRNSVRLSCCNRLRLLMLKLNQ